MSNQLQRTVEVPKAVLNMLEVMGIPVPPNMKEIETVTEFDEHTNKIILPKGMDKMKAAKELKAQYENEETKNDFDASFEGWNWRDVLVAIRRVTEREMGWMNGQKDWWTGNPKEIDVVVDVKNGKKLNEKAFLGNFRISGWEDADAVIAVNAGGIVQIRITAKRKYSEPITNYFNVIREQLETQSIYRGKSIRVTADANNNISFEIIENKVNNKIVLNEKERKVVDVFVRGSLGEPGKRCYLFTGGYGTGKTETAMQVGFDAVEKHGMSFFYLKDGKAFDTMLAQSVKYQPCLIFMEDIDQIASGDQRDAEMNRILNTLDGVETKGNNLTVIFTTNHESRINPALRRPGRIDLMVLFDVPNKETCAKIYQAHFEGIKGAKELDYKHLAELTPVASGAVIAEIAKRAVKLAKNEGRITDDQVTACLASMEYQIKLMSDSIEHKNKHEEFVKLFGELLGESVFTQGRGSDVYEASVN